MDFMERRKVNIMCVHETKWKGSNVKELGNGFKLFYIGEDGRRNGVGIILNDEMRRGMVSVKRRSDRIIWVKVAPNGDIINIMSAYMHHRQAVGRTRRSSSVKEWIRAERYTGHGEIVDRRGLQWPLCKE